MPFQSTHPSRGATVSDGTITPFGGYFNPRTPHGVRPAHRLVMSGETCDFNPRTPHGVRRYRFQQCKRNEQFQSTHPSRGATDFALPDSVAARFQSTHPSRGATSTVVELLYHSNHFNPRPPHGVRPVDYNPIHNFDNFNPRTPHGVRHGERSGFVSGLSISIHAPLTGCDQPENVVISAGVDFNPRTPHGVRPPAASGLGQAPRFQSTHPSRGATTPQLHLQQQRRHFNPRTPHGVRHFVGDFPQLVTLISIHAPLTGCDVAARTPSVRAARFQSTHPSRGATYLIRPGVR